MTAAEALNDGFFRPGHSASLPGLLHLPDVASSPSARHAFDLELAIGRRGHKLIHGMSHREMERTEVQSLSDLSAAFDMLPLELRNADTVLVDIRLSSGGDRRLYSCAVHKIRVAVFGQGFLELEFGQSGTDSDIHAVAGIPCSGVNRLDRRLNMTSDDRGRMEMHLGLWIRLEIVDSDHVPRMLDLFREVHCQMMSIKNDKGRARVVGWVKGATKRLPHSVRKFLPEKLRQL